MKGSAPNTLVSVIVPFYQPGDRLRSALESIAASSHPGFEVLMIDDAGDDQGTDIARGFAARDSRFRYFRNPENRKVSYSRNRGIGEATGEYLLFVDSDDRISPDWMAGLLRDAVREQAEVVIGKSRRCLGGREEDYPMSGLRRRGEIPFSSIVLKDNSVVWNKLYAVSLIRRANLRFDESIYIGEDLLFNYLALRQANRIYYSDHGYYCYHAGHADSIMRGSDAAARAANFTRLLVLLADYAQQPGPANPGVLRKVAKDVLINHDAAGDSTGPDAGTMRLIRQVDGLLPEKVRLSRCRKAIRRRLAGMFGLERR